MRRLLLIIPFFYSCLSFGQDSLHSDTTLKTSTSSGYETIISDSVSSSLNDIPVKKKKQKKKAQKKIVKDEPIAIKGENTKNVDETGDSDGLIIIGILIFTVIVFVVVSRSTFGKPDRDNNSSLKDDDVVKDYLSRILLPRREYYRNVYLKSKAWKRKRYVVLRRDNWRCVYCGGPATQVHHTRYAKRNIGKEPIEWLVSICKTCHDSKH